MARSNPLFVDSTKFHGDRIGTQIELSQVLAYEGESVVVRIVDHQGEEHRLPMQATEEAYVARVWLHHQRSISYQFLIMKDEAVLFKSKLKQVRAQYAIVEEWDPEIEEPIETSVQQPKDVSIPLPDTPWSADFHTTVESLIEKWGL